MKKEPHFGKIARLPDTTPDAPIKPEETRTNKNPITNQADTKNESGFSGQLNLKIPKTLHEKLFSKANQEGVSLVEYIIYKLSQ